MSGSLAGVCFALLYLVLDLPLALAAAGAAAVFAAAFLILPSGKNASMRMDLESQGGDPSMRAASLEEARLQVEAISKLCDRIAKPEVRQPAQRIVEISRSILSDLRKDPAEIGKARHFLGYYLDAARKVMDGYVELSSRGVSSPEITSALERAERILGTLGDAFDRQRANLAEGDVANLDVELRLLESNLKMESAP